MSKAHFTAPTGQQVRSYLSRHRLHEPSRLMAWMPLLVLVLVMVFTVSLSSGGAMAAVLPWLGAGGILVYLSARVNRLRQLGRRVARAQELAMLRHWPQALRMCWRLAPDLTSLPHLHSRVVTVMAMCLDQVKAYDSAIETYGYLVRTLPADQPGSVLLRIHYAITQFADGRLSDADATLARLRGVVEQFPDTPISATYHLARLTQQVRTNHWSDAVERSADMIRDLRPLGVDAGFGYALMALSYQKLEEHKRQGMNRHAKLWWLRATTLLPQRALIDRYSELASLADVS